jgi:hypothetical protein
LNIEKNKKMNLARKKQKTINHVDSILFWCCTMDEKNEFYPSDIAWANKVFQSKYEGSLNLQAMISITTVKMCESWLNMNIPLRIELETNKVYYHLDEIIFQPCCFNHTTYNVHRKTGGAYYGRIDPQEDWRNDQIMTHFSQFNSNYLSLFIPVALIKIICEFITGFYECFCIDCSRHIENSCEFNWFDYKKHKVVEISS